ncbi:MAG: hypothetical protein R2764_14755 [Bacteroidales bacterium]
MTNGKTQNKIQRNGNKICNKSNRGKVSIPLKGDYDKEYQRIKKLAKKAKEEGKEIVVVMGLGFVGVVMAAIVADTKDEKGNYTKYVIGYQRPSVRSFWKIPVINKGISL